MQSNAVGFGRLPLAVREEGKPTALSSKKIDEEEDAERGKTCAALP